MAKGGSSSKVCLVMLSAGASTRMGQPKQLLPWKGTTLLQHSLNQALESDASHVILVLGYEYEQIRADIDPGRAAVVINPHWEKGMSSSIHYALKYLKRQNEEFGGVMFCLSDQPLIDYDTYNNLIAKFLENKDKIVSSAYPEGVGVPVVFPCEMLGMLNELRGDKGAKSIIKRHPEKVLSVDIDELSVDLDTMERYEQLFQQYGR